MCLPYVKFLYPYHLIVVMGAFRYYVIQNASGAGVEVIGICNVVNRWVALKDNVAYETFSTFSLLVFNQELRKVAYITSVPSRSRLHGKFKRLECKFLTGAIS